VYSVGKLGGAHRRGDKDRSSRGRSRGEQTGAWTNVDPSGGNTGQYDIPPYQDPEPGVGIWQDVVPPPGTYPPGYPISGNPTSGYPSLDYPTSSRPTSSYPSSGYPSSGYPTSSQPTSSRPTSSRPASSAGYGGSRRASSTRPATKGSKRRPVRYTGQRRRFSGWVPLVGGVLMLALVLGATTLAEAGRYSDSDGGTSAAAPTAASTSAAAKAPVAVDEGPAQAVATALNAELDQLGCGRVTVDKSLVTAAQLHVDAMAASATSVKPDTSGSLNRAKTAGYKGAQVAEAIVTGAGSPAQAAQLAFPAPGTTPNVPSTIQVTSGQAIACGWTSVGAQAQMSGDQVTYWSIVLGR
jgi:hypothetical protein